METKMDVKKSLVKQEINGDVRCVIIMLCLMLFGFTNQLWAQTSYRGHIVGSDGIPVEYATAVLLSGETLVAGAVSDSLGIFQLEAEVGIYNLVVQCIGYETLRKELTLPMEQVDDLVLAVSNVTLKEVVVQAKTVERQSDRFVMSVLPSTGKDGTELLSQAPGVWLSDDDVSINGANGTKVFVDNREIRLEGEELLTYLRSLKSDDIKSIEIIPIAGAEYDASARGGVILISLRHRQSNGIQGYVSMGTNLSKDLNAYVPSVSVNAKVGNWNLSGAFTGTFSPKDDDYERMTRTYTGAGYSFVSESQGENNVKHLNARFGAIWEIDSLRSLGAEIEYVSQAADGLTTSSTDLIKTADPILSTGVYDSSDDYNTFSTTVNYVQKWDERGSVFKVIADYVKKHSTGDNHHNILYEQASGSLDTTYRYHARADYDMATVDASLQKMLGKQMSYKVGAKYTYTLMDDYSYYQGLTSDGKWSLIDDYGYSLRYSENIIGAYATFSTEINHWSIVAGLRAEYSETTDRDGTLDRDYFDLFPNLNVTYAFDPYKKWLLIGQYARNIERPAFYTLNPNRVQSSDYSYSVGNPYLRPEYIHRSSLTLVYNYVYTLTIGGNLHQDLIREYTKEDTGNADVSYLTYENHDRENHWYVSLSMPFRPASWFSLIGNFIGVRQDIRMTESSSYETHHLWFANLTATLKIPASITLEADYSGTSRLYSGNSEQAPIHTFGLTAKRKFCNDKFLLTASVDNIFNHPTHYGSTLDAYRAASRYASGSTGRSFKLTLTWNFNSGKKVKKERVESGSSSERNRLEDQSRMSK